MITTLVIALSTALAVGDTVRPGIEVLLSDSLAMLSGKRVGLITNHTGRDREGRRTIDLVFRAPGVKLVALFGPEHGLGGVAAAGAAGSAGAAAGAGGCACATSGVTNPLAAKSRTAANAARRVIFSIFSPRKR